MTTDFKSVAKLGAMDTALSEEDKIALLILKQSGLAVVDAALLLMELLHVAGGRGNKEKRVRNCIRLGVKALDDKRRTVSFEKAAIEAINARRDRRKRTVEDCRYILRRLMKFNPEMKRRPIRFITPKECSGWIDKTFSTTRQKYKARLVLSGVFGTAVKRGWCDENPVTYTEIPRLRERVIPVLSIEEVQRLVSEAESYDYGSCLAATGLLLYAGIRPHEVERLDWGQIDMVEGLILIKPRHSKTGGARVVTIHPILKDLLIKSKKIGYGEGMICPKNWKTKWKKLRYQAGWDGKKKKWIPDILRHTYASYFARHFKNFTELQIEMGHSSCDLLRTRYLNMEGITKLSAAAFWGEERL